MNHDVIVLILGFVLGSVLTSGIWAILQALSGNDRRYAKQRRSAMYEIAAESAEIDNKISAFVKKSSSSDTASAIESRIESIKKALEANTPFLDVYFVKYLEGLFSRWEADLSGRPMRMEAKSGKSVNAVVAGSPEPAAGSIPINFDKTLQFDFSKDEPHISVMTHEPSVCEEKMSVSAVHVPLESTVNKPEISIEVKAEETKAESKSDEKSLEAAQSNEQWPKKEAPISFEVKTEPNVGVDMIKKEAIAFHVESKTEAQKKEKAPVSKKQDIEEDIVEAFDIGHAQETKKTPPIPESATVKAPPKTQRISESSEEESLVPPEKSSAQHSVAAVSVAKEHPDDFISSDDLIDKIDSFFGIKTE